MSDTRPADHEARITGATGPGSYIVRAPAGSGKTSLLVQRFLYLLGRVDEPESVLAITFTRKAAAEMRNRIMDALQAAHAQACPQDPHGALNWQLARKVIERSRERGWRLAQAPTRLRVQTIDSLCADLARRMPLLSDMGALPEVTEDARPLYREAAEAALDLNEPASAADALRLAEHLDGNMETAAELIASMLAVREQWLPHIGGAGETVRDLLEQSVQALVDAGLHKLDQAIPGSLMHRMLAVTRQCRRYLGEDDGALPDADTDRLQAYRAAAALVLTKDGALRQKFTKREGVPAPASLPKAERADAEAHKAEALACVAALADLPDAREALTAVLELPATRYTDPEWEALNAAIAVMRLAALHLRLVFARHGTIDFGEVQSRALTALGKVGDPSELALALDHRISHILVDEFQDTSIAQVELLSRLTTGWQPDDGHSLFVVGDPMQSIYRFRQAEVGNFLRAEDAGIGDLPLEKLELKVNFRSSRNVVEWVNQTFAAVLPAHDDADSGQIRYRSAEAANPGDASPAVHIHPFLKSPEAPGDDGAQQAARIGDIIEQSRAASAEATIAILVRARSHLSTVLPMLEERGIQTHAVELKRLDARQCIHDLHALTLSLVAPADPLTWLTLLRAPWCGLPLHDLHAIYADEHEVWLRNLLSEGDTNLDSRLSAQGQQRLTHLRSCWRRATARYRRFSLRSVVEAFWIDLGGAMVTSAASDQNDIRTYLEELARNERAGTVTDLPRFETRVNALYAEPQPGAHNPVQVMTMHKAKGLEFDTVIIPALERQPSNSDRALINWRQRLVENGDSNLLLAPLERSHHQHSGLYSLIQKQLSALFEAESARLLYVGATRARAQLHLLGSAAWDQKNDCVRMPDRRSLLGKLWPAAADAFGILSPDCVESDTGPEASSEAPRLQRLAQDFFEPAVLPVAACETEPDADRQAPVLASNATARHTGTVVHRWLERVANEGIARWNSERVSAMAPAIQLALEMCGVRPRDLETACARVCEALCNTLQDKHGAWLLGEHEDAHAELALSASRFGQVSRYVIDRTFVDDGIRWIVDYKTSTPAEHRATQPLAGAVLEAFVNSETAAYESQLERYAELFWSMEQRPIRLGLYFPMLGIFKSWAYTAE